MKQSDFYMKVITGVILIAVLGYIGVSLYNALMNTYVTTAAVSYTVEHTIPVDGFIVRTETVLHDGGSAVSPIIQEGAKVAVGQTVAVEYTSSAALETASEIRTLRLMIAQHETSENNRISETAGFETVMKLSLAIHTGDLSTLDELMLKIETDVFARGIASNEELELMRARLETLENRNTGVRSVTAPISGTFSHVVDGFEHIKPEMLADIMPEELTEFFETPLSVTGTGKVVSEFKWYFVAILDAPDASRLQEGRSATVQFTRNYHESIEMHVESIGRRARNDGTCVVLFSSDRSIHDVSHLRNMRADIVVSVVTGIRVPKEAIHLDENARTHIYLQTGVRAERVNVEIIQEFGDSYLVRDGTETGTPLRPGSIIIVKANNLYDGKIVA